MEKVIQSFKPKLNEIFTHLHTNPEISWEEVETTNYIKSLLKNEQCNITTFDDMTGLVVEIGSGKPVIAIRADIDALWQEVNGKFRANHSCGHDAHMTIVIGTLYTLLNSKLPKGTFRFIFQPAEEKGTGALAVIEKGIVDDVDYLYGMHLRPIQELPNGKFAPAIQHGAAKFMNGKIKGEDAHAARPHLNVNAIQVGSEFVHHLQQIQLDPAIPHSVKFTSFQAGGKSANIIPGNATFTIDLRAQTNEAMDALTERVHEIAKMLANYHHIEIELEEAGYIAASILNDRAIERMKDAIIKTVGDDKLAPVTKTTGGDDFHFYTMKRPHIKATMLAIGCDLQPGLHHPNMTFNHDVIPVAVEILSNALINSAKED